MNREIKFRCWVTDHKDSWFGCDNFDTFDWNNRMREVRAIYFPLGSFSGKDISLKEIEIEAEGEDNYANGWTSINDCKLMQFTGLKDKNEVEIYEGDIVIVKGTKRHGYYITKVIYSFQGFTLDLNHTYLNNDACLKSRIEVIGNIHKNPELLEK